MKAQRKQRLYFILAGIVGVSIAVSLVIYALGQNINLYYTPSQVAEGQAPKNHIFRIGGMVKSGSIQRIPHSLQVNFALTDYQNTLIIHYTGILPALFHENQGIVVQGKFDSTGRYIAEQVLAKHDEKYMPPNIKKLSDSHDT